MLGMDLRTGLLADLLRGTLKVKMLVSQLCPTLCDPMDCSPPGSSVHGFLRQEYWSGLPFPSPGDLLTQGSNPSFLHCRQIGWDCRVGIGGILQMNTYFARPCPMRNQISEARDLVLSFLRSSGHSGPLLLLSLLSR